MNRLLRPLFSFCLLLFLLTTIVHAGSPGSQVEPARLGGFTDTAELTTPAGAQPGMFLPLSMQSATTSYGNLEELILPSFDYGAWYKAETGYTGNDTYFGAYALQPVGDTLYLGFGTARPAENVGDGALLASTDGSTVTSIYEPSEQGFIDMTWQDGSLYIPGADPTDPVPTPTPPPPTPQPHQWDWGNTYVYTPTVPSVVKHRNLPDVIHTWGNWYDTTNDTLYVAASGCDESNKKNCENHYLGQLFSTTDNGSTWTEVARGDVASDGIGQYRTYDIIGFDGKLYITWNDVYGEPCGIAESSDGGATWTRLSTFTDQTTCRTRLFVSANQLLALSSDQTALLALDSSGAVTTHSFPDFSVKAWAYNYLAEDSSGRLYTVTEDGRVVRSSDLNVWETVASSDRAFITIAYWPNKDRIILAERTRDYANLWQLDPSVTALTLPAAPTLSIARNGEAIALDWDDVANAAYYRVYRSTSPYFSSHIGNRIANLATSQQVDNGIGGANVIGDIDANYFYLVRSRHSGDYLSTQSNRVGEFDFPLVAGS